MAERPIVPQDLGATFYMVQETQLTDEPHGGMPYTIFRSQMFAILNGIQVTVGPAAGRDNHCWICLKDITSDEMNIVHSEGCGWGFHADCVDPWASPQVSTHGFYSCPSCRAAIAFRRPWQPRHVISLLEVYIEELSNIRDAALGEAQLAYHDSFSSQLDVELNLPVSRPDNQREIVMLNDMRNHLHAICDDIVGLFRDFSNRHWVEVEGHAYTLLFHAFSTRRQRNNTYRYVRQQLKELMRMYKVICHGTFDVETVANPIMTKIQASLNEYNADGNSVKFRVTMRQLRDELIDKITVILEYNMRRADRMMDHIYREFAHNNARVTAAGSDGSTSSTRSNHADGNN